jgi:hypothetical protein
MIKDGSKIKNLLIESDIKLIDFSVHFFGSYTVKSLGFHFDTKEFYLINPTNLCSATGFNAEVANDIVM